MQGFLGGFFSGPSNECGFLSKRYASARLNGRSKQSGNHRYAAYNPGSDPGARHVFAKGLLRSEQKPEVDKDTVTRKGVRADERGERVGR